MVEPSLGTAKQTLDDAALILNVEKGKLIVTFKRQNLTL